MEIPHNAPSDQDEVIDFGELLGRLRAGFPTTLGLAFLGASLATILWLCTGPFQTATVSTRVVFSFSGFEKGEYPDRSKFQADDLRSPEIIADALKRKGLEA